MEQTAYVASLSPGAELDLRGTTISGVLLLQILNQVSDPATGKPRIGAVRFDAANFNGPAVFRSATFDGDARFDEVTFNGDAVFDGATFNGKVLFGSANFAKDARFESATFTEVARFDGATFAEDAGFDRATFAGGAVFGSVAINRYARFNSATFDGEAWFVLATFHQSAGFDSATFNGSARFDSATFTSDARFSLATFTRGARFSLVTFARDAQFSEVVFERAPLLGPFVCGGVLDLSGALFGAPVTVEVAAKRVVFRRTRWAETATIWLRYADADLSDAVFDHPLAVAGRQRPFADGAGAPLGEGVLTGVDQMARVVSLRGVDAAHLVLTDLDLSRCLFSGTIHLDQLRLEGRCPFCLAPAGFHWRGWRLVRNTHRITLAEEQHWCCTLPRATPGWQTAPDSADQVEPALLATLYRALRKSYEDSSNEPGAADFYYGEMEMRRADTGTDRAERGLLTAYWALSGYGLRAARALGFLLAAVTLTMLVMMLWGLPNADTTSRSTGTVTGRHVTLTTDSPAPVNPTGPLHQRLTSGRFEKSLRVVVNSVIFRSSGQDLTTTGTYTEMASRLTEPVLLGLAAFAVRGRIKR